MALVTRNNLKNWFVTAAKPTQEQFWAWLDSYWHKDESIPTSKIAGLDDLFSGVATTEQLAAKANKDASNIEETDRTAWRDKLGVGDLPKDLVYTADLSNYYTRNETNNLLDNKLDYPEEENGSSTIPTQLVGLDADGESIQVNPEYFATKSDLAGYYAVVEAPDPSKVYLLNVDGTAVAADSFGKNIGNSNLTQSSEDRTYNQNGKSLTFTGGAFNIQGATNFQNATQQFSGLLNKSADATYTRLGGLNSAGNFAEVGLYAMTNEMSKATDAMKEAWRIACRKTGENYSTGQPRVDAIFPKIVTKQITGVQYVSLVGINLFINNTSINTSVTLINTADNSEYLISEVQVSQTNQQILVFGIDFASIPDGTYKVRVINNTLQNIDSTTFNVISDALVYQDLSSLSWEKYTANGSFSTSFGEGNYAFRDANAYSELINDIISVSTRGLLLVSDEILNSTDANANWMVKIESNIPVTTGGYQGDVYVGILDSSSSSSSIQSLQPMYGLKLNSNSIYAFPSSSTVLSANTNGTIITYIIKQGSLITVIVIVNNTTYKSVSFSLSSSFTGIKLMLGCGIGSGRIYDNNWKIGNIFKITKF